jgi:lipopolysaccharide export LptBFGC system permease protein LptF
MSGRAGFGAPGAVTDHERVNSLLRLPLTIWRSITGELLRVLLATSASLLGVIAFAGAVKPLAEGQIGLGDALVLTMLLLVPMLQFAAPFAAGFASTMSYHRMASDNEAVAAAAGGVSHRAILLPAFALGLVLALALGALSNDVMPSFLRRAERLVHRDIARLLIAPIEKGLPIHLPEWGVDVYAEEAQAGLVPPSGSGAIEDIALFKVLLVRTPEGGAGPLEYVSAERADLLLFEDPDNPRATAVQIVLSNATMSTSRGTGWHRTFSTNRLRVPTRIDDDPKYLSFAELAALREKPRRMRAVDDRARRLIAGFGEADIVEAVRTSLEREGRAALVDADRVVTVLAGGLERAASGWRLVPVAADARIGVSLSDSDRTQSASGARLRLVERAVGAGAIEAEDRTLELVLEDVLTDAGPGRGVERAEQTYTGLIPLGFDRSRWDDARVSDLLAEARARERAPTDAADDIRKHADRLDERVAELNREITSKTHERIAYPAACLVMVVTGAIVALRMRESLPLPVYLWSFLPALLAVITISTGQRLTHRHGDIGLLVLWGGVAALTLYTALGFWRLRRH